MAAAVPCRKIMVGKQGAVSFLGGPSIIRAVRATEPRPRATPTLNFDPPPARQNRRSLSAPSATAFCHSQEAALTS